jgi:hypothetical protein
LKRKTKKERKEKCIQEQAKIAPRQRKTSRKEEEKNLCEL